MTDIAYRLRKADLYEALDGGEYYHSDLPNEAADEIERLREGRDTMGNLWAKANEEVARLQVALRINGLRCGYSHQEIDKIINNE